MAHTIVHITLYLLVRDTKRWLDIVTEAMIEVSHSDSQFVSIFMSHCDLVFCLHRDRYMWVTGVTWHRDRYMWVTGVTWLRNPSAIPHSLVVITR